MMSLGSRTEVAEGAEIGREGAGGGRGKIMASARLPSGLGVLKFRKFSVRFHQIVGRSMKTFSEQSSVMMNFDNASKLASAPRSPNPIVSP